MSSPSELPLPTGPVLVEDAKPSNLGPNTNADGDLIIVQGQQIENDSGETYAIVGKLGSGQFGQVYEVYKNDPDQIVAITYAMKVSKCGEFPILQFTSEARALSYINSCIERNLTAGSIGDTFVKEFDPKSFQSILSVAFDVIPKIYDTFMYEDHFCIVEDKGGPNFLSCLSDSNYRGWPLYVLQKVGRDVLCSLAAIHAFGVVHSDIKPDNIVQSTGNDLGVKLVDFGNCVPVDQCGPMYWETRFYRAPEILLRLPFNEKADIWSFGCTLCELFLGLPIFPAQNEIHLACLIEQTIGPFPKNMIDESPRKEQLFGPDYSLKPTEDLWRENPDQDFSSFEPYFVNRLIYDIMMSYPTDPRFSEERTELELERRKVFISFIMEMLTIDPEDRLSAREALNHDFFKIKFDK